MGSSWGLFLCNCRGTLGLERERLVFPTAPAVLSFGADPATDLHEFAARAARERVDRVLIGCCSESAESFVANGEFSPKVHVLDLKTSCFLPHAGGAEAHAKANRLLRAEMEAADQSVEPVYNRLVTGNRVIIASDDPNAAGLVRSLRQHQLRVVFVSDPAVPMFDIAQADETCSGRVIEVHGRLGDFRVCVESAGEKRELRAGQVVIISTLPAAHLKRRTGLHVLEHLSDAAFTQTIERIQELTGEFLKPIHVSYETGTCAGGGADQEACGACIAACPYDAIGRAADNHLRVKIDHLACEGCGACVSACPTTSMRFAEPSAGELYARMAALLAPAPADGEGGRSLILFHCGEQGRRVLQEAVSTPLPYPATVLPIEVPCLRYVSDADMLAAFGLGAAGVALLGCETCRHGKRDLLRQKYDFCRVTLNAFDPDHERLCLVTAGDQAAGQAIETLTQFANSLADAPLRWDRRELRGRSNREVIADVIAAFIEQTRHEPGTRALDASQSFADAEVAANGCTLCRACVNVCPVHAFSVDENTLSLQFQQISCVACGLCEKICPEHVITLRHEIALERKALTRRTVVADQMVSCTNCGKPYINKRALETVEARLLGLGSLLDTFSGGRRTLLRMCPDCRAAVAMLEVEKGWKP